MTEYLVFPLSPPAGHTPGHLPQSPGRPPDTDKSEVAHARQRGQAAPVNLQPGFTLSP